ncbi:hypothetical protein Tco_0125159 [Tanacetum coccineum]
MADENVPAPAPTRYDDQFLPFAMWVPIEKSNHVLDLQKRQKNIIFQIVVDILQKHKLLQGIHCFCLGSSYLHSTILEHAYICGKGWDFVGN